MTIAIGIVTRKPGRHVRPSILLASDSQTTYGEVKSVNNQKLSVVDFGEDKVLIAQAGSAELADKAIEILQAKASKIKVENHEDVAKAVQESVRQVRDHLIDINRACNFKEDEWYRFFMERNYFELMFAYFYNRNPYLCTIDVVQCLPFPVKGSYKAIGVGKDLAEFLIGEYAKVDPDFEFAYVTAIAAVEKTIDNIDGCGRPTWVGRVFPMPEPIAKHYDARKKAYSQSLAMLVDPSLTEETAKEIRDAEKSNAASKKEELLKLLQASSQRYLKSIGMD